jgi:YD repeat-containing protein
MASRRTSADDPDLGLWTYEYDLAGRLTEQTGARGLETTLTYDQLGRVLTKTSERPGGQLDKVTDSYDEERSGFENVGRLTTATMALGATILITTAEQTFDYDQEGRLEKEGWEIAEPDLTTAFTWNAAGNLTNVTQTDTTTHSVPYPTNGQARTWTFTYTTGGLLDTVDGPLPGTGDTVDYDYDASGYLAEVTDEVGLVTTIVSVNGRGQPTEILDPNGKHYVLGYDALGPLTFVTEELGATDPVTTFAYNKIDQVTKVTLPDGSFLSYTYGPGRRLTSVENNAGERIEYTYNFLGNVTAIKARDSSGAIVESQTRTFDELGRLLRLIGASAQDWTHAWDKADNLVEVEDPRGNLFSYAYDGLNRLVEIVDEDGSETHATLTDRGDVETHADPISW